MAVLEKIRVKFGLTASIIIAIGLLMFIIDPSEIASAINGMSSKNDVGKINGKSVSYVDFQEEVQKMSTVNELLYGSVQSAQQQEQIRDAVWQNLIYRNLFNKEAHAAGIYVGDDEMVDLTTGSNVSPLVTQIPIFLDEQGNFSKENMASFLQNMDSDRDGSLRLFWHNLQENIMNSQYYSKYASLFNAANGLNAVQLKHAIADNNNTTDVKFVTVPFGYTTDSTIVVSDSEIKSFYNDHKKLYRQQASRDMEYVVFEVIPSAEDIAATKSNITSLVEEFAEATNVRSFLVKNSNRAYSEYWYKQGELRTAVASPIEDYVWGENSTQVSDVMNSGYNFYVARVMDTKSFPDSALVKHILLQGDDADHKADSLVNVLKTKKENFANLVAEYSVDQNSNYGGELGTIGWMTQSYTIPGMETAVLTAKVGEPFKLNTQYGSHVVLVVEQTKPTLKKQVAILEKEAIAGKETINNYYNKANNFAVAAAGSYSNYRKAVDTIGVYSHPVNNMLESANRLGSIDNTKEVTRWVFDNKAGSVSPIMTIDNNYFIIATVKQIHKEGYATLAEVSPTIRQQLYSEKQADKMCAQVAEKIQGLTDLDAIAETLGSSVSTKEGVAFSSLTSQGMDPKFIGALTSAPEGKVSGPVAGSTGVYVFQVTGRDTGSFYTEDDATNRDNQMNSYLTQLIVPVMMQDKDVKDNRARFY